MNTKQDLAVLLQGFFTKRLMHQRQASPHTIAAYRDTFRLLLVFAQQRLRKEPCTLSLSDLDAPLIADFLQSLEENRSNKARTRNLRLTAIRAFFHYAAYEAPSYAAHIQRVLAIPRKRYTRELVNFLNRTEIEALLAVPDRTAWNGRRDYALLLVAIQTGLRVSELTALRSADVVLEAGPHVRCLGKGRKERSSPLTKGAAAILKAWIEEPANQGSAWLFPSAQGGRLSTDGVQYLLAKHATAAGHGCPSLSKKRVTPHVLRHTTAMELLQSGVDRAVIALWLGHESMQTTQIYLDANLALKEEILSRTSTVEGKRGRYRPNDQLLSFLKQL
jgi:site-specific recombinase XerD